VLLSLKDIRVHMVFCSCLGSVSFCKMHSVAPWEEEERHWIGRSTFGIAEDGFVKKQTNKKKPLRWIESIVWG